jgi:beta-glucosidase
MFEGLDTPFGPVHANADVEITATIRNTGRRSGRAVVQAYLSGPHGLDGSAADAPDMRPVRVLAGFGSARAEPGELVDVRLRLPARLFARWDDATHGWIHPRGRYKVEVGNSSRDLRMSATFDIE